MKTLPYIFIVAALIIGAGIYLEATKDSHTAITNQMLESSNSDINVELKNYGKAPEFTGLGTWLNSEPLKLSELRGKVVLVDFWTYSCINCVRTLPYITHWDETYRDKGLIIIGIHTPEFGFEAVTKNVETALKRHNIKYPVAQDNDYMTWNAYSNQYWPAKYLIDQNGNIVYTHFGEGNYEETEAAIQKLLELDLSTNTRPDAIELPSLSGPRSPEMYFGSSREEHMAQTYTPGVAKRFTWLNGQEMNQYQLEGTWIIENEKAVLQSEKGRIRLRYKGSAVHMVASSTKSSTLKIFINNVEQTPVTVKDSQLYTLFQEDSVTEHELVIDISGSGLEAFTFTFG